MATLRSQFTNAPNLVTMGRVLLVPVVLLFIDNFSPLRSFIAGLLFLVAAAGDGLDGYLARSRGEVSVLGKFLDPLADKLIVLATLVLMVELGHVPAWPVIIIAGRELSITALRTIAISEGVVIAASRGGKDKTAVQMVALVALILHDTYVLDWGFYKAAVDLNAVGLALLYLSVFFALTSAGEYMGLFVQAVEAKEKREREDAQRS